MAGPFAYETRQEGRLYFANRPLTHLFYAMSRRLGPVVRVPRIGTVINDAEVARAILTDGVHFNSSGPGSFGAMITEVLGRDALINTDGADHRARKALLQQVFSPRYVTAVSEAAAGPRLAALTDRLRAGETVDFAAFMRDYGCAMACALIGIAVDPGDEAAVFADIFTLATEIMAFAGTPRATLSADQVARARGYGARIAAHIEASYASAAAPDHSLTALLRAEGLDFAAVRAMVSVVLVGATELVIYGLPRALAVIVDSGAWPRLQAAPERIEAAIDEALRLTTPSNAILRSVAADCSIAGHRFRRGERVIIAFRNILRSPALFAGGEGYDLDRVIPPALRRLAFGAGPHVCLGGALTLTEMRQVLGALLALPAPLVIGARRRNRGKLYPGYTRLDIRLASRL